MIDTGKLPRLQPQTQKEKEDSQPFSLFRQIVGVFSGKAGILCTVGVLVMIYVSLCVQGERLLRREVYNVFKKMGNDGFGISYATSSSYLAYKSDLNLDDLVITAPEEMGGWRLKAGGVSVSSMPFSPRNVSLKINGTHSLKTKTIGDIRLIIGSGDIKLRLPDKNEPFSAVLSLKRVQTGAPRSMDGFFISDLTLTAGQSRNDSDTKTDTINFSFRTDDLRLPAYITAHLPPVVKHAKARGELSGSFFNEASFLKGWMNSSGTVEIGDADILWPPFALSLSGTFGFNDSFELMGAGIGKAKNFFTLLDMLQNGDYLRPKRVSVAKVVLGKQAETDEELTSAFSVQSGKFYIGKILLYDNNE